MEEKKTKSFNTIDTLIALAPKERCIECQIKDWEAQLRIVRMNHVSDQPYAKHNVDIANQVLTKLRLRRLPEPKCKCPKRKVL